MWYLQVGFVITVKPPTSQGRAQAKTPFGFTVGTGDTVSRDFLKFTFFSGALFKGKGGENQLLDPCSETFLFEKISSLAGHPQVGAPRFTPKK